MANRRSLAKSISMSKKLNASLPKVLPPEMVEFAQLLYTWMIPHCDDFGRLDADPWTVKMVVMPASQRPAEDFEAALEALDQVEALQLYESPQGRCMQLSNWNEFQEGLHKRTKSRFPEPPARSGKFPEIPGNSGNFPPKRREEKGRELNSPPLPPPLKPDAPPLPPARRARSEKRKKTKPKRPVRDACAVDWKNGLLEFVVGEMPEAWRAMVRQPPPDDRSEEAVSARGRYARLMQCQPRRVLATVLDIRRGSKHPRDPTEAMTWLFSRLNERMSPSDGHYQEATKMLKAHEAAGKRKGKRSIRNPESEHARKLREQRKQIENGGKHGTD